MTTPYGPCADWPVRWPCDVSCESPTITGQAVQFATETVWALSGRQFGLCTVTLRPCRRDCESEAYWFGRNDFGLSFTGGYPQPALIGGEWYNLTCGGCAGGCSCSSVSEVVLPAPVHRIVSVVINDTPVVTGAYRLDDARLLVRTDGGEWPLCNDLSRNDGEGTWSVTAEYGLPVPEGGAWAVGELACQFIRARNGEDCSLPQTVQTLARQGVTISFPSPYEWYRHGLTGLYLVDTFVRAWNPNGLTRRARVLSVDGSLGRRAT